MGSKEKPTVRETESIETGSDGSEMRRMLYLLWRSACLREDSCLERGVCVDVRPARRMGDGWRERRKKLDKKT